jgi:hypothetical protein
MKISKLSVCLSLSLATACGEDAVDVVNEQPVVTSFFYVDGAGDAIGPTTPDDALLDKVVGEDRVPVTAPDGERLTWGEFRTATGSASIHCDGGDTLARIDATGLVPDAVYTAWMLFFQAPGFEQGGFDALTGFQALGPADGSQSRLETDAAGAGSIEATIPAGEVAIAIVEGSRVPSCLADAYEVHLVLAYHMDGQTCGLSPCDDHTIAEQLGFAFAE